MGYGFLKLLSVLFKVTANVECLRCWLAECNDKHNVRRILFLIFKPNILCTITTVNNVIKLQDENQVE